MFMLGRIYIIHVQTRINNKTIKLTINMNSMKTRSYTLEFYCRNVLIIVYSERKFMTMKF